MKKTYTEVKTELIMLSADVITSSGGGGGSSGCRAETECVGD